MNAPVALKELGLKLPNITLSRTSLLVTKGATEEDLAQLEVYLDAVGGSSMFWWGDYINHLVDVRGAEYARAKAACGYSPESLKQAAYVCRHVDRSRRLDSLTFGHHQEVAALSPTDQEIWLAKADEGDDTGRWTQKRLRAEIRQSKAQVTNGADQAPEDQRAARASASYEQFSAWYQGEQGKFSNGQQEGWDRSFDWLVDDYLTRNRERVLNQLVP